MNVVVSDECEDWARYFLTCCVERALVKGVETSHYVFEKTENLAAEKLVYVLDHISANNVPGFPKVNPDERGKVIPVCYVFKVRVPMSEIVVF